jgi:hypothetical protein
MNLYLCQVSFVCNFILYCISTVLFTPTLTTNEHYEDMDNTMMIDDDDHDCSGLALWFVLVD